MKSSWNLYRRQIEQHLCQITGRDHALLTGRGAAGIEAALRARGLVNAAVGIPANTCYIVLWAILRSGNLPVLLDVNPQTGMLDVDSIKQPLAALIPCHLYGLPAPMAQITAWAQARDVFLIEDAALAIGGSSDGRANGAWGDVSIFSFGPGKVVDHYLGGAVLTDDPHLAEGIHAWLETLPEWDDYLVDLSNQWLALYWALHQYDDRDPRLAGFYPTLYALYNPIVSFRLPDDDANGLLNKLHALEEDRLRRLDCAALYDAAFNVAGLETLPRPPGSTLWAYPLLTHADERDDLLHALWDAGVHEAARWYPSLQPMRAALCPAAAPNPSPNADALAGRVITLPVHAGIDAKRVRELAAVVSDETCK
jgi:dTDP-4-amino-4,6-dideoxygalactose transaminase